MANKNQDWDDLGRSIQDIVDRAVNSRDFQKLNQTVSQAVGKAVDMGSEAVRKAMEAAARPTTPPARPVYREVEATVVEEKKDLPVLYAGTGGETAVGLVKIVGGGLALLTGFISLIARLARLIMGIGLGIASTVITVGGVVAGAQKHPLGQRRKGYHIPRLQAHRGALHPDHFIGDLHLTVLCLSRFQGQKRRHNFSRAGHRQLFLRGFLVQHRTVVRSHQNRRLSGNGRLSAVGRRRRSRAGKDSSCSQQSA